MNRSGTIILLAVALTIGVARAAAAADSDAGAEPSPRIPVSLVLDASGSMWGRVDGEVKMEIARAVVRDFVVGWGDRIDLGIVAYGHRRKGDCSDIESLVLPGRGETADLLAAVEGVSPRGKTPLAAAIEQAANDLDYRDRRAVVTIVSDGRETCGLDPCAVASRLATDGADFTAHVIGFDLTEEEGRELRCIASATGGVFARAANREELVGALGRVLTRSVQPAGPPTLILSAARGDRDQPLHDGVRWTVKPLDARSDASAGPQVIEGAPDPIELTPGRYDIRAEYAGTTIDRHIALHAGQTWREHVRFGPGQLALSAVLSEGEAPITDPLHWSLHPVSGFGRVAREPVHEETGATCLARVEAGHYEVRVRHGDTERRLRLEVKAGVIQPRLVDLDAGEARIFAALPAPGGPFLERIEWTIRPLDDRGDLDAPIVERRTTNEVFVLPVGRYHVTARHDDRIGDAVVNVLAGSSKAVGVVLYDEQTPAAPAD